MPHTAVNDIAATIVAAVATCVGGVALVVTIVLLIIGVRIGSDIRDILQRVQRLEERKEGDTREFRAFRTISGLMRLIITEEFKFAMSLYVFGKLQSAQHGAGAVVVAEAIQRRLRALTSSADEYRERLDRYLSYLLLMEETQPDEFYVRVTNTIQLYPDENTVGFLELIFPLFSDEQIGILEKEVTALKVRLRGIDSSLWTGIKR